MYSKAPQRRGCWAQTQNRGQLARLDSGCKAIFFCKDSWGLQILHTQWLLDSWPLGYMTRKCALDLRLNVPHKVYTSLLSGLECVNWYLSFNSISVTIYYEAVDLDELIPKGADIDRGGTATICSVTLLYKLPILTWFRREGCAKVDPMDIQSCWYCRRKSHGRLVRRGPWFQRVV